MIQQVAIYARVSTDDQSCERQVSELQAYAVRCGYEVVQIFRETASGAKNDRKERAKVIDLAKKRRIGAVLVSELSRWGRSTEDLLATVKELTEKKCSLLALNGQDFDLSTATGKLMLTLLAAISEFERGLLTERINSGLAEARRKGVVLGRPKAVDINQVLKLSNEGLSVRKIAAQMKISPTTVQKLKRQHQHTSNSLEALAG